MFLFHLVFKAFPFETNAGSDYEVRNSDFVYKFETSPQNVYKVKASESFLDLISMMMEYDPVERMTIDEIF